MLAILLLAHTQWRSFLGRAGERQVHHASVAAADLGLKLASLHGRVAGLLLAKPPESEIKLVRTTKAPHNGVWAQLSDDGSMLQLYAKDQQGDWWLARFDKARLLANIRDSPILEPLGIAPRFPEIEFGFSGLVARACMPISGSMIAVCTSSVVSMVSAAGIVSVVFLAILISVLVLVLVEGRKRLTDARMTVENTRGEIQRIAEMNRQLAVRPPPAQSIESQEQAFGAAIGLWRADFSGQMIELGPVSAAMLGSAHSGVMPMSALPILAADSPGSSNLPAALSEIVRAGGNRLAIRSRSGSELVLYWGCTANMASGVIMYNLNNSTETLLRSVIEAYPGPLAAWDAYGRLQYWNGSFQRTFRLSGQTLKPGASRDTVWAEASRAVRYDHASKSGGRELMLLTDEWISYIDRPIAEGGSISAGLDVTHIKRQEMTLKDSERKMRDMVGDLDRMRGQAEEIARRYEEAKIIAERASQSKSVFLANMSHELRTPLNAINGFSEMLVKQIYGPLGDERYIGYAEDILRSGQHLLDMINDILDTAKIEAGKMSLSLRRIDPIEPIDAAMRMMRRHAADKQIILKLTAGKNLPEIEADHRAIKQMVLNLVSNAIKFTDPGGRIDIVARVENNFVAVSVRDTGIGIPEQDLSRLAQPFEQASTNETRNVQGTGLGLALTRSFAEMHGGKMTIHSKPKEGSVVTFYLPIEENISASGQAEYQQYMQKSLA